MSYLWSCAGVAASLVITIVIAGMNFVHGGSLIANDSKLLMSCGMLALDGLKAAAPFFIFSAWSSSRPVVAFIGVVLWLTLSAISFFNVTGFLNTNRSLVANARESASDRHEDRRSAIAMVRARIDAFGLTRPSETVEREIHQALVVPLEVGNKRSTVGLITRNCEDVSRLAAEHCGLVLRLRSELASALANERARSELAQLLRGESTVRVDADPQTHFLLRVLGGERITIETWTVILLAAGFEMASSLGLFVSLSHAAGLRVRRGETRRDGTQTAMRPAIEAPKMSAVIEGERAIGEVAKFACDCLAPESGNEIAIVGLYPTYAMWCDEGGLKAHERETFVQKFKQLCSFAGFPSSAREGEWIVQDLGIIDSEMHGPLGVDPRRERKRGTP